MPVTVVARNTLDGILVLGSNKNANDYIEWQAAGDPSGDDVKFVSGDLADTPGFRTALARGVLVLEEDETDVSVVDALKKQVAAYKKRQDGMKLDAEGMIERTPTRDVVTQQCVGPNGRGQGKCGDLVTVSESKKDAAAPLCSKHKYLKHEFVPTEITDASNEDAKVQWVRVSIDKRK